MTKTEIKEALPMVSVAEHFGIPMQERGKEILCICPWHNDHNFGSCYMTRKSIVCRACGSSGDIFNVIETKKKSGFKEALDYAAKMLNSTVTYDDSDLQYNYLTVDEISFLGIDNNPVKKLVDISFDPEDDDPKSEFRQINDYSSDIPVYGKYITVTWSPLRDMCVNSPEEYKNFVNSKVLEKEKVLMFIQERMTEELGELGFSAIRPLFQMLIDIQRKIGVDVTVVNPIYI